MYILNKVSNKPLLYLLAVLVVINAFLSAPVKASTIGLPNLGDLNETSNITARTYLLDQTIADSEHIAAVLDAHGLEANKGWQALPSTGLPFVQWAASSGNSDTYWDKGFWSRYLDKDTNQVWLIDFLYKDSGQYVVNLRKSKYGLDAKHFNVTTARVTTSPVPVPVSMALFLTSLMGLLIIRNDREL
jgi:hypothetical protein